MKAPVVPILIGDLWTEPQVTRFTAVHQPSSGDVIARTPMCGAKDVELAVVAGSEAYPAWSGAPVTARARVLFRYRELLEAHWGARPLEKLSSAIHTQTEGSPLFVGKMVRFLAQDGVPTATDNVDIESLDTGLPEGIREAIARRLSPLSLYANDVLSIAALIGRDFGFAQLAALVPEDSVQDLSLIHI